MSDKPTKKRWRLDWPNVAALGIVAVCGVYLAMHLDAEKAEAWAALLPPIAAVILAVRGKTAEAHDE